MDMLMNPVLGYAIFTGLFLAAMLWLSREAKLKTDELKAQNEGKAEA